MTETADSLPTLPPGVYKAHDSLFKAFLGNVEIAKAFFQAHLPEEIKAACDLETLKLQPPDFIEPNLKQHLADILYGMQLKEGEGYLYVLIEHESEPQQASVWRTHRYCVAAMQQHLAQYKTTVLPIVLPLLFYRGPSAYPYSNDIADLFCDPKLGSRVWYGKRLMVDLHRIPDDQLRAHSSGAALLELAQKHVPKGNVLDLLPDFERAVKSGQLSDDLARAVLYYFMYKGECSDREHFARALIGQSKRYKENIMTMAQQWKEEGLKKGRQEGEKEGKQEAMRQAAQKMLANGLDTATIKECTQLSDEELKALLS